MAPVALTLAVLACARADVPAAGGIGSGGLALPSPATVDPSVAATEPSPEPDLPPPTLEPTPTAEAPEAVASPTFPPTPTLGLTALPESILYLSQSGDTPLAVAARFGVIPEDLIADGAQLPPPGRLIDPGTRLILPRRLAETGPGERILPDSELVFSPNAAEFDVLAFASEQGGYLNRYQEYVGARLLRGPEILAVVARDNSVNPRLLLALLEYESGWVTQADRPDGNEARYPLNHVAAEAQGLFRQLTWAANELGNGYYGWRAGTMTSVRPVDGEAIRLTPELNAGTAALQHYFTHNRRLEAWIEALGPEGFRASYEALFGDPESYEYLIYEPGVEQPSLILPFLPGHVWAYTGGPHGAWERESAWAALDFAPPSMLPGCVDSSEWIVAAAPGLVVRSGSGVVVLDLDGDGREQTGWSLLYLHVAENGRVRQGDFLEEGDLIGHPSCEGGVATGTHLHLARKYNGEWVLADGPLPFVLSGWEARAGSKPYQGALVKDGEQVLACTCASKETHIRR